MTLLTLNWIHGLCLAVSVMVSMHHDLIFAMNVQGIVYFSANRAPWQLWRCAIVKSIVFWCKGCWLYRVRRSERKIRRLFCVSRFSHESMGIDWRSSFTSENTDKGGENHRALKLEDYLKWCEKLCMIGFTHSPLFKWATAYDTGAEHVG